MERPLRSQFALRVLTMNHGSRRPIPPGIRLRRRRKKRVEHGSQLFKPTVCDARVADGIRMSSVIGHRGSIKPGVLIDKHNGGVNLLFVGNQSRQFSVQHGNGRHTGFPNDLRHEDPDSRVHCSQRVYDPADVFYGAIDALSLREIVCTNMQQHEVR